MRWGLIKLKGFMKSFNVFHLSFNEFSHKVFRLQLHEIKLQKQKQQQQDHTFPFPPMLHFNCCWAKTRRQLNKRWCKLIANVVHFSPVTFSTHSLYIVHTANPLGCKKAGRQANIYFVCTFISTRSDILATHSFYTLIWIKIELQIGHGFRTLVRSACSACSSHHHLRHLHGTSELVSMQIAKKQKQKDLALLFAATLYIYIYIQEQQRYWCTQFEYIKSTQNRQGFERRLRKGFQERNVFYQTVGCCCCWLSVVSGGSGNWWHFKFE